MKKLVLAAALCMLASAALADATITLTLSGAAGANTSRPLVVSDADSARIIAWAKDAGGPVTVPPVSTDPNVCNNPLGTPPPAACFSTTRIMTNKEAIEWAFDNFLASVRANALAFDRAKARKAAEDAVAPITPK